MFRYGELFKAPLSHCQELTLRDTNLKPFEFRTLGALFHRKILFWAFPSHGNLIPATKPVAI